MSVQQQESITITTISNDSNNNHTTTTATTFVSKNGNHLQMTWERNIAMEILQRANQHHHHHDNDKNSNHNDSSNSNIIPTTTTTPTPYMVAIAGIPGSGKSSSAEIITHIINNYYNHGISSSKDHTNHTINNTNHTNNTAICVCIPADGYHYDMKTLQDMERQNNNDTSLIYRRGAPDTFNVTALLHDLQQIRYPQEHPSQEEPPLPLPIVKLPGFDHAIGDPILHQHIYDRNQHSIIIMEGLYLLYNQYQWEQIKDYFHETIYIQTHSIDTCMERLKQRNVVLPGYTIEEIHQRVDIVDRNNAILIDQVSPSRAHQVITSTTTTSVVVTATTTPPSL